MLVSRERGSKALTLRHRGHLAPMIIAHFACSFCAQISTRDPGLSGAAWVQ